MIPFDWIFSSLNKLLTKARAKYGSLTIIGWQFLGRLLTYFCSIKHALALIFFKSLRYLIFEKKDKSLSDEFEIVFIFKKTSLSEISEVTFKELLYNISLISLYLIFFKLFKFQIKI